MLIKSSNFGRALPLLQLPATGSRQHGAFYGLS